MADYSIFILGESDITISDGGQLDGVTQGDGSHMVGLEVTLNSAAWDEILIIDDDTNFQDSDGSQKLNGAQMIDGVLYANGTVVEAEYSLVLTDGTDTWTAIAFNVNNSAPAYGTVEGLAFIGGPGGFPPAGVPLTVVSVSESPSFAASAYATPICYARGTMIETVSGPRPIESLRIDDLIQTADHGLQPLRWVGGRHVVGVGRFAPVELAAGLLGAAAPLRVSQQHRVLVCGSVAELHFGEPEVLVPVVHLVDGENVRLLNRVPVEYFHLVLDRHEVIFANGVSTESLHCAQSGEFSGVAQFFPELADIATMHPEPARRSLRRHEAELLVAQSGGVERLSGMSHSLSDPAADLNGPAGAATEQANVASGRFLRDWIGRGTWRWAS